MYRIQMRYTDIETGYLEETRDEAQAEVYTVFHYPLPESPTLSYHVEDFATREDAEACVAELEYLDEMEEEKEESENN